MKDTPYEREAKIHRRIFLTILLLGLLALTGASLLVFFEELNARSSGGELRFAWFGFIWFSSGGGGLLGSTVLMRGRFVKLLRGCGIALILLCGTWLIRVLILNIEPLDFEQGENWLLYAYIIAMALIGFAYVSSIETRIPMHQLVKKTLAISLLVSTILMLISYEIDLYYLANWMPPVLVTWIVLTMLGIGGFQFALRWDKRVKRDAVRTIAARAGLTMTCPSCSQWQEHPSGPTRCDACGLRLIVNVEEPRCECGYLLYRLQGDVCPECGKVVED